jgi:HEAT repeat protein
MGAPSYAEGSDDAIDRIDEIPYRESDPATAVAKLRPSLDDPDVDVREATIMALASVEGDEANQALAEQARREPDAMLKSDIVDELIDRQAPEALDTLLYLLGDADPEVRERAADGLDELGDKRATPALQNALRGESDEFVRDAIVFTLSSLDPDFDEDAYDE